MSMVRTHGGERYKGGGHAAGARGEEGRTGPRGENAPSHCGPWHSGALGRTQDWRRQAVENSVNTKLP